MADPINYCSWFASSFCITQSEWATWTQAWLTVGTFAFAMWRQKVANKRAEKKVAQAEEALHAERLQNSRNRALATAIAIRVDVTSFNSVAIALPEHGFDMKPSEAFAEAEPNLGLRLRAMDALHLQGATQKVLAAIDGAHSIHNYLQACRKEKSFGERERAFLTDACAKYLVLGEAAYQAIVLLVAEGLKRPEDH